ncbi:hypothetical protein AtubIFM56815_005084 [Aspergillus tubingensis]|uniref:Uncharacterized protein n=2 Tax=Aspergillus subgen. Circumdati TaxID=2720871 RepID=A0A8H3SVV5_ASPTU|nr:DUF967 domain protein [Aspergillus neoniger CBS 115656]XP_035357726.1 DUF967 domain protein [Aspergillus tubingensis]PYH37338.1 DUF967 domain protein [Aspergillus neoniger CBS 115656]GFN16922.1 DUF967 domain protein [Aspergillus tubingensis]GLA81433.1 hypothetical protein AtubIFM56815_005084 [Aspergillus tubingensis]
MEDTPLPPASTDPRDLAALESNPSVLFPTFTSSTAWTLGLALRERILSLPPTQRKPALISITLTGGSEPHVIFQCATEPGTVADNEVWVRRKRNTVLRWGVSSWLMRQKMLSSSGAEASEVEAAFVRKFALTSTGGGGAADEFAIHGGAFPIRVRGVDGIVGVVVVSGLKQEDDHQVVVETVREVIAKM